MQVIIGSLIGAVATLIGAALVYNLKISTISKNSETIVGFKEIFSSEHRELSDEHKELLRDNDVILEQNKSYFSALEKTGDATFNTVTLLAKDFEVEKAKEEMRYKNLSNKQLDLVNIADKINAMGYEIKDLSLKLNETVRENTFLKEENTMLKDKISELEIEKNRKRNRGLER